MLKLLTISLLLHLISPCIFTNGLPVNETIAELAQINKHGYHDTVTQRDVGTRYKHNTQTTRATPIHPPTSFSLSAIPDQDDFNSSKYNAIKREKRSTPTIFGDEIAGYYIIPTYSYDIWIHYNLWVLCPAKKEIAKIDYSARKHLCPATGPCKFKFKPRPCYNIKSKGRGGYLLIAQANVPPGFVPPDCDAICQIKATRDQLEKEFNFVKSKRPVMRYANTEYMPLITCPPGYIMKKGQKCFTKEKPSFKKKKKAYAFVLPTYRIEIILSYMIDSCAAERNKYLKEVTKLLCKSATCSFNTAATCYNDKKYGQRRDFVKVSISQGLPSDFVMPKCDTQCQISAMKLKLYNARSAVLKPSITALSGYANEKIKYNKQCPNGYKLTIGKCYKFSGGHFKVIKNPSKNPVTYPPATQAPRVETPYYEDKRPTLTIAIHLYFSVTFCSDIKGTELINKIRKAICKVYVFPKCTYKLKSTCRKTGGGRSERIVSVHKGIEKHITFGDCSTIKCKMGQVKTFLLLMRKSVKKATKQFKYDRDSYRIRAACSAGYVKNPKTAVCSAAAVTDSKIASWNYESSPSHKGMGSPSASKKGAAKQSTSKKGSAKHSQSKGTAKEGSAGKDKSTGTAKEGSAASAKKKGSSAVLKFKSKGKIKKGETAVLNSKGKIKKGETAVLNSKVISQALGTSAKSMKMGHYAAIAAVPGVIILLLIVCICATSGEQSPEGNMTRPQPPRRRRRSESDTDSDSDSSDDSRDKKSGKKGNRNDSRRISTSHSSLVLQSEANKIDTATIPLIENSPRNKRIKSTSTHLKSGSQIKSKRFVSSVDFFKNKDLQRKKVKSDASQIPARCASRLASRLSAAGDPKMCSTSSKKTYKGLSLPDAQWMAMTTSKVNKTVQNHHLLTSHWRQKYRPEKQSVERS